MSEPGAQSGALAAQARAAAVVAAVYAFFLLFAQFAFLRLASPGAPDAPRVAWLAGFMAASGIIASLAAVRWHRPARAAGALTAGLATCALAAGAALSSQAAAGLGLAAVLTGAGLGWTTVTLAAGLRAAAGVARLGRVIGAGTGAAYALCNLPPVFEATPRAQTTISLAIALTGAVLAARWPGTTTPAPAPERGGCDYRKAGIAIWLGWLLALVWFDSAAFYVIQQSDGLRSATWAGPVQLGFNALVHLGAALLAGAWLDRGGRAGVTAVALALLVGAAAGLHGGGAGALAAWAYAAGVSLYSVALVHYPAHGGRPGLAALVYAVAGWGGSAAGIGMARDLGGLPAGFVAAGATAWIVLVGATLWLRRASRLVVLGIVVVAAVTGVAASAGRRERGETLPPAARGRAVYVAEGCINCHSQFVRPGTEDVLRWGPELPLAQQLAARPPLPGNRRLGPDLANVANRRSPAWQRVHLRDPRLVSPGSAMPAYAHLFADGDGRGEALLAYLATLGGDTAERRAAQLARWQPVLHAPLPDAGERAALFRRACAACHGEGGRGDGPAAPLFSPRPADLTDAALITRLDDLADGLALERTIKFGKPGTSMPGHEALQDREVCGLAGHVRALAGFHP